LACEDTPRVGISERDPDSREGRQGTVLVLANGHSSHWPHCVRQPGSTFSCLPCSRQVIYWSMIVGTPLAVPLFSCSFTGAPGNFSVVVVNFVI
jgi:hypothetical protein